MFSMMDGLATILLKNCASRYGQKTANRVEVYCVSNIRLPRSYVALYSDTHYTGVHLPRKTAYQCLHSAHRGVDAMPILQLAHEKPRTNRPTIAHPVCLPTTTPAAFGRGSSKPERGDRARRLNFSVGGIIIYPIIMYWVY